MKKFLISAAVSASILGTAAFAAKNPNNLGDFLIAPQYYADGSFTTDLKVVNTSLTDSVIYRVVVRDFISSEEVDFIILLSPGDVWDAEIYQDADDGKTYLRSDDDSSYSTKLSQGKCIWLGQAYQGMGRSFKKGYVEFYPVVEYVETTIPGTTVASKISKSALKWRFDHLALNSAVDGVDSDKNNYTATASVNDVLYGTVKLSNDKMQAAMAIPMTALSNVSIATVTNATIAAASPSQQTVPAAFLAVNAGTGNFQAWDDLALANSYATYSNKGANNALYFTFWYDHTRRPAPEGPINEINEPGVCYQARTYEVQVRNMEEDRESGEISPAPVFSVHCEETELSAKNILANAGIDSTNEDKYVDGQMQIRNLTNTASTRVPG
jgi:hypothetical protein